MEKDNQLTLYKTRSAGAIVSDAYQLYTGNFKRLFRAAWPMAIIYALAFALMTSRVIYDVLPMVVALLSLYDATNINWLAVAGNCPLAIASVAIFALAALLLASVAFNACRQHRDSGSIERPAKWWGTWPGKWYVTALWRAAAFMLTQGLRFFGLTFATALLTALITLLLTFFCELPAIIMAIANIKAYTGAAMGDPLGMPDHLPTLTFAVFAIAGFIQAFVHLATVFPFYYAYGSITTRIKERKENRI